MILKGGKLHLSNLLYTIINTQKQFFSQMWKIEAGQLFWTSSCSSLQVFEHTFTLLHRCLQVSNLFYSQYVKKYLYCRSKIPLHAQSTLCAIPLVQHYEQHYAQHCPWAINLPCAIPYSLCSTPPPQPGAPLLGRWRIWDWAMISLQC